MPKKNPRMILHFFPKNSCVEQWFVVSLQKEIIAMEEVWKEIKNFEGYYEISNLGNIRSLTRINTNGRCLKGRLRKPYKGWDGHLRVRLSKGNKLTDCLVHRLVALAFIPNPNNLPQINHKDENPHNNCVENLEWCTCEYNLHYGTRVERCAEGRKIAIIQESKTGDFIARYSSIKEAETLTSVCHTHISSVAKGKRKYAGGFVWKYEDDNAQNGKRLLSKPTKGRKYKNK